MKPGENIKSVSYLKANAPQLIKDVSDNRSTVVITQNGEAKVILQDYKVYKETENSIALLKILASSARQIKDGRTKTAKQAFSDLHKRIDENTL